MRSAIDGAYVALTRPAGLDAVAVTLPATTWTARIAGILQRSLGLTRSEREVFELMLTGKSNVEISHKRHRSIDTVKSQTRSIFRKLGVSSRVEAVQVVKDIASLAAFSGAPSAAEAQYAPGSETLPFAHDPSVWRRLRIGERRIGYVHYPLEDDPPAYPRRQILLFHGLAQGPELSKRTRRAFFRAGFELIGVSKPGYGASSGAPSDAGYLATCVADAHHIAKIHGFERPVILAHLFGAHAALKYCRAYPFDISGIVFCSSYFPLQMAADLQPLGALQKLATSRGIASRATHSFIVNAGFAYLRYGGAQRYLKALAEQSPSDREALQDDDIFGVLQAGIRHVTQNGRSAFLNDSGASRGDWTALVEENTAPSIVLHGQSDPAVNSRLARFAAERMRRARYEEVPEVGQQLLHVVPEMVAAACAELFEHTRQNTANIA
ncbi:alpha/beta fold hydrolase [Pseudohoeflea coraliihabitans]|uniref:Alpha/beta fold hydrolase n=1 Tax=Pseudohoeflea coraliihabitans TaxID=2860393 RepID=A0ABS6WMH7_9HYPH|nr:alpha/beta fold hydrolase [Pseudohoeflea sp. DP4N28-3]